MPSSFWISGSIAALLPCCFAQLIKTRGLWACSAEQYPPSQTDIAIIQGLIHCLQPCIGITSQAGDQGLIRLHLAGAGTGELDPRKVATGGAAGPQQQGELLAGPDGIDGPADRALDRRSGRGALAPDRLTIAVDAHFI